MKQFGKYVDHLRSLVGALATPDGAKRHRSAVDAALDGEPARRARSLIGIDRLRAHGAFFTGSTLARRALRPVLGQIGSDTRVLDPACGTGDLLVACAMRLPVGRTLSATLGLWGRSLFGRDLHPQFVSAAKLRLALAAIRRGARNDLPCVADVYEYFPGIDAGCGLKDLDIYRAATEVVINPPFTMTVAPHECNWASGQVNAAALFLEACMSHAKPSTRILAILPDVLRSGSRYRLWRHKIESLSQINRIELLGKFDRLTDVDVFVADFCVRRGGRDPAHSRWVLAKPSRSKRVSDYFDVCVGPVVPHRDPKVGRWFPFVTSRSVAPWTVARTFNEKRRYAGRTFNPPFVVVRRTSSPDDKQRPIASLIIGRQRVAVENHLLILQPKSRSVRHCSRLLRMLKDEAVGKWLNQRICCRHLTVSAVRDIPMQVDLDA